ncbi:DNA ligase-associated DEXH box helicase [bacterium TMED181]|nr:DNA ligase-associated DEXH box helicase [Planctomycetota bacterium]OUW47987.1 MAG: DNA ligase-associated DEXH box helicase [bacterium TMED181]
MSVLHYLNQGLYCPAADAWIDPPCPVKHAIITHAHADHARPGCGEYWACDQSETILRQRLGRDIKIHSINYGEEFRLGQAKLSLHSAGHVLGSAQVRIEVGDEVWLVTGDYKRCHDPSCEPFESVKCDVLITESTFGLPIYRWKSGKQVAREIYEWWRTETEHPSLLFCYAFGKAQRVLAELKSLGIMEEVLLHGAVETITGHYREAGVDMVPTRPISELERKDPLKGRLIIAPPSAYKSPWMKRFKEPQTAFASGWMAVRGARRRRGYERGFVLSDHADWTGLIMTIKQSEAKTIYITHGQEDVLARYLTEVEGLNAFPLEMLK